ncbi:hypothetical protein JHK87_018843 [Glycine soja]|nr:hypothetical protein JHK87_018843 [Glycine soja]
MEAAARISEANGVEMKHLSIGLHGNKNSEINDALQMQIELQRRLHEKHEFSTHLEPREKSLFVSLPLSGLFNLGKWRMNPNLGKPLEATANCELSSLHYLEGIDVPTA